MLLVKENEKRHVVYCLECARRHSPQLSGYICLEEHTLEDLQEVYDNFVLHSVSGGVTRVVRACSVRVRVVRGPVNGT